MTNRQWRVTKEAKKDLQKIALYTKKEWGLNQKNAYLKSIETVFSRLVENPEIGLKRQELAKDLRSILAREQLFFINMMKRMFMSLE